MSTLFSRLIIFFTCDIIEGVKDTLKNNILDIVSEMYEAGIDRSLCTQAGEMALKFEGVCDLMVLWSDEVDPYERECIIEDLRKTVKDAVFFSELT